MYVGRSKHPSNLGLGYNVVMNLSEPYQYLRHHLYFDHFFTSLPLIEQLARNQTYSCGTFRANRKGIPPIFKNPGQLAQGQSILIVTLSMVNRRVPCRSGQPGREIRQVSCPASVVAYNTYMGGELIRLTRTGRIIQLVGNQLSFGGVYYGT